MAKRHEIRIRVGDKEVVVATDDLETVFEQEWFQRYVNGSSPSPDVKSTVGRTHSQREQELESEVKKLREQLMEMREYIQKQQQKQRTPPPPPQPPQPPQSQSQQLPAQEGYLEITPDEMNPDIWGSLSPEQQQQWLSAYNMAS